MQNYKNNSALRLAAISPRDMTKHGVAKTIKTHRIEHLVSKGGFAPVTSNHLLYASERSTLMAPSTYVSTSNQSYKQAAADLAIKNRP